VRAITRLVVGANPRDLPVLLDFKLMITTRKPVDAHPFCPLLFGKLAPINKEM
jgi:hypothetical protein